MNVVNPENNIVTQIIYCLIEMLHKPKSVLSTKIELDNNTKILIYHLYDIIEENKEFCDSHEFKLLNKILKYHELL
jgi:hypothetical protein